MSTTEKTFTPLYTPEQIDAAMATVVHDEVFDVWDGGWYVVSVVRGPNDAPPRLWKTRIRINTIMPSMAVGPRTTLSNGIYRETKALAEHVLRAHMTEAGVYSEGYWDK